MSSGTIWSFVVTIVGLVGFILAGRKVWWAWYVNIACQALWFVFGLVTAQYGFILSALVYTVVFTQNAIKWTKERKKKPVVDPMYEAAEKAVRNGFITAEEAREMIFRRESSSLYNQVKVDYTKPNPKDK